MSPKADLWWSKDSARPWKSRRWWFRDKVVRSLRRADGKRRRDHHYAADHVVPQEGNVGAPGGGEDRRLARQHSDEHRRSAYPREDEGDHEAAEQRSVEERPYRIHGHDQRTEPRRHPRERHRVHAPEQGEPSRCPEIMMVGGIRPDQPLVDVDHTDGGERIDLTGG